MLRRTLLTACLLLGAGAAQAQTGFIGTLIDVTDKQPIANVLVTVRTPNAAEALTTSTDAGGNYAFEYLTPGIYALRFENEAYKTYERDNVTLPVNHTMRINVEMQPLNPKAAD